MSDASNACLIRAFDRPAFDLKSIDLTKCERIEINTALNEFERARPNVRHGFDTWPPDVQKRTLDAVDHWNKENPKAVIRLVSSAIWQNVAVLVLHFMPGE